MQNYSKSKLLNISKQYTFLFVFSMFMLLTISTLPALSLNAGNGPGETAVNGDTIISMSLEDYRVYQSLNGPLDRVYCERGECFFLVNDAQLAKIEASGLPVLHKEPAMEFTAPVPPWRHHYPDSSTDGDPNGNFHNVRETYEEMRQLESAFPDLARVITIGSSVEGRELNVIKISDNVASDENEPNFFYVGMHHAREWITVEVPLNFARYLLENYSSNPEVQKAVSGSQIYIMPIQNPDGLEFSIHTYRWWRKNRSYQGNFIWGVDPNRNYGYNWGIDNEGSSPLPYSYVYRGPSAFSEPENRAVRDFLMQHPPTGTISYHSYSQIIIYPWGHTYEPAPDAEEMRAIASVMTDRMYQVSGRVYGFGSSEQLYLVNGDTTDWVYGTFGTPAFTVELPPRTVSAGGFVVPESLIGSVSDENIAALMYFNNYLLDKWNGNNKPGEITGPVKDSNRKTDRPRM